MFLLYDSVERSQCDADTLLHSDHDVSEDLHMNPLASHLSQSIACLHNTTITLSQPPSRVVALSIWSSVAFTTI